MQSKALEGVIKKFSAVRAVRNTERIWEQARGMDAAAFRRAVNVAVELLREAGVTDVRVEEIPSDGKTAVNGWLMPVEWSVSDARLESAAKGRARRVFADYSLNPQNIAQFSPATPDGNWVEGEVVEAKNVSEVPGGVRGKFLLLQTGYGSIEVNVEAAKQGALGIIAVHMGPLQDAARYLNYSVPLDAGRPCVPVFSLTANAGKALRAELSANPRFRLRARVKAARKAGTLPIVTGTIGYGAPEIYVCGHIDEIGAQDNASGCGAVIEALRVMQMLHASGKAVPQKRAIRFFFSAEIRGVQGWLAQQKRCPNFLAGINLDMVGGRSTPEAGKMMVLTGFQHHPHFAAHVIRDAAALADKLVGGMVSGSRHSFVSDAVFGITKPGGHVSLEQKTGPTYHSSADTVKTLHLPSFRWTGVALVSFLYQLTRLDNRAVLELAHRIHDEAFRNIKDSTPASAIAWRRAQMELESLRKAFSSPNLYPPFSGPAEFYKAGVRRSTGCWPEFERGLELDQLQRSLYSASGKTEAVPLPADQVRARNKADRYVPLALERGFLSFEDHITPEQVKALKQETGMEPGWSASGWAWMLMTAMTGKQTVAEIVDGFRALGMTVDYSDALRLTQYLVAIGRVRWRPILSESDIRKAVRKVGVKSGMILVVHTSLSEFGYVRGGPATVVAALRSVLGPKGTLLMPTHSNSVLGVTPYDPKLSKSNVGAVTEYFRLQPGVIRSAHPTHSVAGIGPAVKELFSGVKPDQAPLAIEGFWGKLVDLDGHVLMMCPVKSCTLFHIGEVMEGVLQPKLVGHAFAPDGRRNVFVMPHSPWHTDHFAATMAAPLLQEGTMTEGPMGESVIRLAPAKEMARISMEVNRRNPQASVGRNGACSCHYCSVVKQNPTA